jgi:hypothetical protein
VAYDELQRQQPAQAQREYIQLLKLAAEESEELVAAVLRALIDGGEPLSSSRVREELRARVEQPPQVLAVKIEAVALQSYDQLLGQLLDAEEVAA